VPSRERKVRKHRVFRMSSITPTNAAQPEVSSRDRRHRDLAPPARTEAREATHRVRHPVSAPVLHRHPDAASLTDKHTTDHKRRVPVPASLPVPFEFRQRLGRGRETEARAGRVREQSVYSRTNRLGNVRARADNEGEIRTPLGGERPIEHPVERVRGRPRLPHI
jgi:hypothetical protein